MRPIYAIVGGALLVALALVGYFLPSGFSTSGSVSEQSPAAVQVPGGGTFLGSVPVTISVDNVPAGGDVRVYSCAVGASSLSSCLAGTVGSVDEVVVPMSASGPESVSMEVDLTPGHDFIINTSAGLGSSAASYKVTVPFWAVQTDVYVAILIVGVVLVGVGLTGHPSGKARARPSYVEESGYAGGGAAPRRFCESCGEPFPDDTTAFCTTCGAGRW